MLICDQGRCPAHALETWMSKRTGYVLFFCRHHGRALTVLLVEHGFDIVEAKHPDDQARRIPVRVHA